MILTDLNDANKCRRFLQYSDCRDMTPLIALDLVLSSPGDEIKFCRRFSLLRECLPVERPYNSSRFRNRRDDRNNARVYT
jgi:hypothetical protein